MKISTEDCLNVAAQAIFDKKGFNILALDVRNVSSLTDFFIIAEGTVDRHVKALSQDIEDALKKHGVVPFQLEGAKDAEWVVMDYTDFVIHLMIPDLRQKYALEELWSNGKILDLDIKIKDEKVKNVSASSKK